MIVEYPPTLPPPLSGSSVAPAERRKISNIQGPANYRSTWRDYGGTKSVSFVFTPTQAEEFRYWWEGILQYGGGWFVANWPLLQSRIDNVFRFTQPPVWTLLGGGLDGLGYWRLSAEVEIRGRGELPELEAYSVTSLPYPVYFEDGLQARLLYAGFSPTLSPRDNIATGCSVAVFNAVQIIYSSISGGLDGVATGCAVEAFTAGSSVVIYTEYHMPPDEIAAACEVAEFTGDIGLVTYPDYVPENIISECEVAVFTGGT